MIEFGENDRVIVKEDGQFLNEHGKILQGIPTVSKRNLYKIFLDKAGVEEDGLPKQRTCWIYEKDLIHEEDEK